MQIHIRSTLANEGLKPKNTEMKYVSGGKNKYD